MKNIIFFSLICLLSVSSISAQDTLWDRKYQVAVYNQYDLRNSSYNAIATHRVLHDMYRQGIKPRMNEKLGNISYDVFSFAATYLTMVWSHEFGHSLRARQVGGEFRIHNGQLPIPYTTMHLPTGITYVDEALSVTGGFEVNHLTVRNIHNDFVSQNGTYNEDLAFSFANRMMYTIYTSIIVPINPKDKEVWIKTAGDPIHCALPVFKNYSNNQVFMADSSVNPQLVSYYNQSVMLGSFFNLLNPQFYREVGATFGNRYKSRKPIFLLGNHQTGWTYSTLFNVSPLGYEYYMRNYIHLNGRQFSVYAKYGQPFKNNGMGLSWNNILETPQIDLSSQIDFWSQDIFGNGLAAEVSVNYRVMDKVDLHIMLGYKTEGYVLGKQLAAGLNIGGGLILHGKY